jgi:hypothetical protein
MTNIIMASLVALFACSLLFGCSQTTDLSRVAGWSMIKTDAWSAGQGAYVERERIAP